MKRTAEREPTYDEIMERETVGGFGRYDREIGRLLYETGILHKPNLPWDRWPVRPPGASKGLFEIVKQASCNQQFLDWFKVQPDFVKEWWRRGLKINNARYLEQLNWNEEHPDRPRIMADPWALAWQQLGGQGRMPCPPCWPAPVGGRDPIVVYFNANATAHTVGLTDGIFFDYEDSGFAEASGWVSPGEGLLCMDRNGNGIIDNGSELFSSLTPLPNGQLAPNGFQALAALDGDGDGKIDAQDPACSQLRVWVDSNGDADCRPGELFTLPQLGITSIDLNWTTVNTTDAQGNIENSVGTFLKEDGTTGLIAEYTFQAVPYDTIPLETLPVPDEIAGLPNLRGSGLVYNLQQAMVRDTTGQLEALVKLFAAENDPDARTALMDQILFKWTGSDTLDPAGRGGNIDARKLAVVEGFFGEQWSSTVAYQGNYSDPNPEVAAFLDAIYHDTSEAMYGVLMAQTHFKDLFGMIDYTVDTDRQQITIDRDSVIAMFRELMGEVGNDPVQGRQLHAEFQRTLIGIGAISGGGASGGGTGSVDGTDSDTGTSSGAESYCDACPLTAPETPAPAVRSDPLVLDLDGDGIETAPEGRSWSAGRAFFDLNADTFAERTGWVSGNDGLLVMDRNGNGFIDNGRELFGSETIMSNGKRTYNSFRALADLDSNQDGRIDASDAQFFELRVWKDTDEDGFSFPTELYTLEELGITGINLNYTFGSGRDQQGNTQELIGSFTWADGSSGQIGAYKFDRNPVYTIATEWLDVPEDIAALPDLPGYGVVHRLHQAMVRDTSGTLKSMVEEYMNEPNWVNRYNITKGIVHYWGVGDGPGHPLQAFFGLKWPIGVPVPDAPYEFPRGLPLGYRLAGMFANVTTQERSLVPPSGPWIENWKGRVGTPLLAYDRLTQLMFAMLESQTHLKDLWARLGYTWNEETQQYEANFQPVISHLMSYFTLPPDSGTQSATVQGAESGIQFFSAAAPEAGIQSLGEYPQEGLDLLADFAMSVRAFSGFDRVHCLPCREQFIAIDPELGWVIQLVA
ncbi:MAG: hypothetical protein AB1646_16780 [Thermodesulfobacteriota bacterium]